jgi:hypothetical protein
MCAFTIVSLLSLWYISECRFLAKQCFTRVVHVHVWRMFHFYIYTFLLLSCFYYYIINKLISIDLSETQSVFHRQHLQQLYASCYYMQTAVSEKCCFLFNIVSFSGSVMIAVLVSFNFPKTHTPSQHENHSTPYWEPLRLALLVFW